MIRSAISLALILMAGAVSKAALSPAEQTATIQAVRDYALSYTKRLPNYICTLTTRHITRPLNAINDPNIRATVVEEQISFADKKEVHKILRTSGEGGDRVVGPLSFGEFGNLLAIIFDPQTGADLQWKREATLDGRRTDVLAFHVPQSSGYVLVESKRSIQVPFEGFVYADAQTHAVLRIQAKGTGFPADSEYRSVDLTLDYKAAQVAGREFILPSHFVLTYRNSRDDRQETDDAKYSAYRQFSADASIQFDGYKQP